MKLGLLHRNFKDAIQEGDGARVCMLWKLFTLLFFAHGHRKYPLEGLILTVRREYTLSERESEQLCWNRFVNTSGKRGKNIPLDLHLEHVNNVTKTCIKRLGSNLTSATATKSSQAVGMSSKIVQSFEKSAAVKESYGKHAKPEAKKDFQIVMQELTSSAATSALPGRKHLSFKAMSQDVLSNFNFSKFLKWIKDHKEKILKHKGDFIY